MNFIWATRGKTWGFRFLRSGGIDDPLVLYDETFSDVGDQSEAWSRVDDMVALRFPDPQGRKDASGRVIPHEFVLIGPWAADVSSVEDGRELIWPLVDAEFEAVWNKPEPPPSRG